jgi:hypothetical protein
MPKKSTQAANTSTLVVNVYDGKRQLMDAGTSILYRIMDGNQKQLPPRTLDKSSIRFTELPFYDNFGDNYTVLVWAEGYEQAGFHPVNLSAEKETTVDLMLLPREATFNFAEASWDALSANMPFLSCGVAPPQARERYEELMEAKPATLAALLNITTAMKQIFLPVGTPFGYLQEIVWEKLAQDRFFAYADKALVDQVKAAAKQGLFAPEFGSGLFHQGATLSYKQVQFGEANVQITFHEGDTRRIDGVDCVLVEPDMDYYKDVAAHALLEVIPNTVTGGLTNPKAIYVLRWIAGRHAGVPEFAPPYVIV